MTPRSLKCTTITEIVHVVWHRDQHGDMDISIVTLRKPGTIDCGSSSSSMGDESNTHHRFNGPLNREDSHPYSVILLIHDIPRNISFFFLPRSTRVNSKPSLVG